MNTKILKGTIIGGIIMFFLGWIVYGILLSGFMESNYNQCIARPEEEMIWWAMIISCLAIGLLITLILKWAGANTITEGLKTGAIFGVLLSINMDLSSYSMSTMIGNLGAVILDVFVFTIMIAFTAMVIVLLWRKK